MGPGGLKLESSDPTKLPKINPTLLSHPFDRGVALESVREILEFLDKALLAKDQVHLATGPTEHNDEDISVPCLTFICIFSSHSGMRRQSGNPR